MIPSLEGWSTKAKEAPSPHEVRLSPLDTNPVFQCLGEMSIDISLSRDMKANTKNKDQPTNNHKKITDE